MPGTLDRLWADYEEHHRAPGNRYCHMAGIPLIIVGVLGLLSFPLVRLGTVPVEASLLAILISAIAYLWLDVKLGGAMVVIILALYLGARMLPGPVTLGLFLAGWVLQFIGHGVYEKRAPAFLHNLTHLLIGPLWVVNHCLHLRARKFTPPASVEARVGEIHESPGGEIKAADNAAKTTH